jgi:AraC family transcriptional regulator, transcriptional activator of pobA
MQTNPLPLHAPFPRRSGATIAATAVRSPLAETAWGLAEGSALVLALLAGQGRARRGAAELAFQAPRLVWLPPGPAGELRLAAGSRGELAEPTELALARAVPATPLGEQLRNALRGAMVLPLDDPASRTRVAHCLAELRRELAAREPGVELAAAHHLSLALLHLWRLARAGTAGGSAAGLVERFVQLAGQHSRSHRSVAEYCRELGATRDQLLRAVQAATGLSPQAYLHRELHREARDLLAGTGLQVAEIGFRLGFPDPAYFNRFFARMEGASPGRFRRRVRARPQAADGSFAAWP